MIRRLLIVIGIGTIAAGGLGLLSERWQFGYVGSWFTVGVREGKLWYVWRSTAISDGEGFYLDDASQVNRAMYSISGGARFRDKRVGPLVAAVLAAVAYALILPPILKRWKRTMPRWVVVTLIACCVVLAGLWITSQAVNVVYYGPRLHLRLANGTVSVNWSETQFAAALGWGQGWSVQRWPVSFINSAGYFSWGGGRIMANVPLGAGVVAFLVPAVVLAAKRRRPGPDHCLGCSYDLTGNVSGVCPECGRAIPAAPTSGPGGINVEPKVS